MRILILNYEFPPLGGGASPISYELTEEFVKAGHEVDVVTMSFRGLPRLEIVNDNFRIHRVPCLRIKKEISHPWEQLSYLISAYFYCRRLLKRQTYDICHAHFIIPTGVLALKLKQHFGLPYLLTSQGSDVLGHNPRFKHLYYLVRRHWRRVIDGAAKIVVPSDFLREEILSVYPAAARLALIPDGIAPGKFTPGRKKKIILSVGRLFKNKGLQDFLTALQGLNLTDWSVVIVGEGPYRQNLEQLVRSFQLNEQVHFLGWVDNQSERLRTLYGAASVFVSPSYFESFGLNVVEAMQAGAIPLVSNIGAYRSLISNSELFFRPGDILDLRAKLSVLLGRIDRRETADYDFSGLVRQRFEWPVIAGQYLEALKVIQSSQ
ncbi:MAG: glycosyltransferase family 4 protein [Patescibacteria group bacterium]